MLRKVILAVVVCIFGAVLAGCGGDDAVTSGGRLYDRWWTEAGVAEPAGDHPLWATRAGNDRSGATTWRCKECHGWDYLGAAGAYGPDNSHYTGFPGILGAAAGSPEALRAALASDDHDFSAMGDDALDDLVQFLREGMVDVSGLFGPDGSVIGGDIAAGERLFARSCASCHGADGREINFGDEAEPAYVSHVALDNPWEFAHKVLHGQPGSDPAMPGMFAEGWGADEVRDVVAFGQTLPTDYRPQGE